MSGPYGVYLTEALNQFIKYWNQAMGNIFMHKFNCDGQISFKILGEKHL
jgi:hypothetical protein